MERARRDRFSASTVPATWQGPAMVGITLILVVVSTPLVVQDLIMWASTGEQSWPTGKFLDAYAALLRGRFGTGLDPKVARQLPTDHVMWVLTAIAETLVLTATLVARRRMLDLTGVDSRHGLATTTQAAEALGKPRLRTSAAEIRPDLHGPRHRPVVANQTTKPPTRKPIEKTAR